MRKIIAATMAALLIISLAGCGKNHKSLTKNIGVANMDTTVNIGGEDESVSVEAPSPDDIVPSRDKLVNSLVQQWYNMDTSDTVNGLAANRVTATKDESFIDICYDLSEADLQAAFDYFESIYPDYYILAINGNYVYCISDEQTFTDAGFTSLANVGTQYIYQ